MSDTTENRDEPASTERASASRRNLLKLGAIAAPAIVTLKPGLAWANSAPNCFIPVTEPCDQQGNKIDSQTNIAAMQSNTQIVAPPQYSRGYNGHDTVPGYTAEQVLNGDVEHPAHLEYIKKLQRGDQGFTCLASIAATRL